MKWQISRTLLLMLFSLIGLSGTGVAQTYSSAPCSFTNCSDWVCQENPCTCYSFRVDVLYFEPQEGGLAYGTLNRGRFPISSFSTEEEKHRFCTKLQSPDFRWDVGFRLHFDAKPACTPVDLYVDWLHFCGEAEGRTTVSKNDPDYFVGTWSRNTFSQLFPLIQPQQVFDSLTKEQFASAELDFTLNLVDIGAGYSLCPTECFRLKPSIAVRLGSIDQKYKLFNKLDGQIEAAINQRYGFVQEIDFKNDFFGAGLALGLNLEYRLTPCFSIVGTFTGSAMKGQIDLRQKNVTESEQTIDGVREQKSEVNTQKDDIYVVRPTLDMGIALRWSKNLFRDGCPIAFQVGWEQHHYYGQNQIQPFAFTISKGQLGVDQANRGDLSMQGWTFSAKVNF